MWAAGKEFTHSEEKQKFVNIYVLGQQRVCCGKIRGRKAVEICCIIRQKVWAWCEDFLFGEHTHFSPPESNLFYVRFAILLGYLHEDKCTYVELLNHD